MVKSVWLKRQGREMGSNPAEINTEVYGTPKLWNRCNDANLTGFEPLTWISVYDSSLHTQVTIWDV